MSKVTKEITVTLKSGKKVTAEYTAVFYYDSNYGADADGNRGMPMWFLDDCYPAAEIKTDDEGVELSKEEIEEADDLMAQHATDKFDPTEE